MRNIAKRAQQFNLLGEKRKCIGKKGEEKKRKIKKRRGRPFPGSRWLAPDSSPVAESSGVIRVPVSLWFFKWSCMVVRVGL